MILFQNCEKWKIVPQTQNKKRKRRKAERLNKTPFMPLHPQLISNMSDLLIYLQLQLSFVCMSTQESEVQLLQDAKRFTEQIQEQQFHLQQADNFPQAFTTEVSKMREQLLKYQNEYNAVKEREFHNQYRLNSLVEEKKPHIKGTREDT